MRLQDVHLQVKIATDDYGFPELRPRSHLPLDRRLIEQR